MSGPQWSITGPHDFHDAKNMDSHKAECTPQSNNYNNDKTVN